MTSASLWLEITIAGFPYLVALFFAALNVLGITDLRVVAPDKNYLPYISAGAVACSYIVGMLFHRLTQMLFPGIMRILERIFKLADLSNEADPLKITAKMVEVWQHGSERLNKEIDFQFALSSLFRSLVLSVPLLGISLAVWLRRAQLPGQWMSITLAIAVTLICMLVYRRQRSRLINLRNAAYLEMQRLGSKGG